ncbi:MAG: hypothetical protein JXA20_13315 [Spirochaetes bacterium]|nr:hypothetical protein [Spirochaetota bacterium]
MKISQDEFRKELLCGLARENCVTVLNARAALSAAVVVRICRFVSTLCADHGDTECRRQSETCLSAADALERGDEKTFLELCRYACSTCPYTARVSGNNTITLQ